MASSVGIAKYTKDIEELGRHPVAQDIGERLIPWASAPDYYWAATTWPFLFVGGNSGGSRPRLLLGGRFAAWGEFKKSRIFEKPIFRHSEHRPKAGAFLCERVC
jgi:hypothetical protein